jgi:hypothetical protein
MNKSKKEVLLQAKLLYQSKLSELEKKVNQEMESLKQEIRVELDNWPFINPLKEEE